MRLPKLTQAADRFASTRCPIARGQSRTDGLLPQHAMPRRPNDILPRAPDRNYAGECCRRDSVTGKFLDCCYGPCRVVDSC